MRTFDWKPIHTDVIPVKRVSAISKQFKLSRVAAEILLRRGLSEDTVNKYLNGSYADMYSPYLFKDMLKAVVRIKKAKKKQETVFIHGDYDADGILSTTIIKIALDTIGVKAIPYVPDRALGYGLSKEAIALAIKGHVSVIITCDCGSNEHKALKQARNSGIDVIVLDHHSYSKRPKVCSFINPEEPYYPFSELCGAGVAFKFLQALDNEFGGIQPEGLLDLVAVATVADAVPIVDENRIIVREGLKKLSHSSNPGMYNLIKVCSLLGRKISTEMVGFIIAPKINAPGRISHPKLALDLFLTLDNDQADKMAHELANINKQRMEINRQIRDEAVEMIEKHYKGDCFLVLHNDSWNKGVIGIVASTIVELYHKPTVIISEGYGSVRTVPEYPLIEPLKACGDLFERWGGHPMAAGLKIKKSRIDAFRKRINEISGQVLSPNPVPYMNFDTKLKIRDVNMNLVGDLERLEPFGNGNPLPHFVMEDLAIARDRVTKDGQHLQLTIRKDKRMSSVVGFWMAPYAELFQDPAQRFDVLFSVERNRKNYEQVVLRDLKEVALDW